MCYFLYGTVNNGINESDFNSKTQNTDYHFKIGKKDDLNKCIEECRTDYRITRNHCDCDSPVGAKNTDKAELKELAQLLINLKSVRGIKHIYISKNWIEETNTKEENVHIDDIDIVSFLANIEENCLYKIELYPRYC